MTLNHHRYKIFEKGFGTSSTTSPLSKLSGINASSIPPCEAEINTHIKRAGFVAQMLVNADKAYINQHPDMTNGWDLVDGNYTPVFHEGNQLPKTLVPQENDLENSRESDDECMNVSSADESDCSEIGDVLLSDFLEKADLRD